MTIVEQSSPRTYPIPQTVVASAVQGYRWARAYEVGIPSVYQYTAKVLTAGGAVDEIELDRLSRMWSGLHSQIENDTGFNPGEDGYPSKTRILASLAGGEECQAWVEKIETALVKKNEETESAVLASIEYDSDKYLYLGLCATATPDVVEMLVRVPYDVEESWSQWDGDWKDVTYEDLRSFEAIEPNDSIVASIVDSLNHGDHLILSYAEPVAWLPKSPALVASTPPDDVEGEYVYAVVDETDTSAVLAAVQVTPGPAVLVRQDGAWVADPEMDEWFRNEQPPTLVLLASGDVEPILAQIDARHEDEIFDALVEAQSITDDEFEDRVEVATVLRAMSRKLQDRLHGSEAIYATASYQEYDAEVAAMEAIVAARSIKGRLAWERNKGNWRRLRRYWQTGKGAAKIRWGTRGDWRRCRRQLFKYLGPRAAGYCFTGDTEFLTRNGPMKFVDARDSAQMVLTQRPPTGKKSQPVNRSGYWVEAEIKSYGEQSVRTITLSRNGIQKVIRATPEHRWFVAEGRNVRRFDVSEVTTDQLRPGMKLAALSPKIVIDRSRPSPAGVMAGLVFGDGSKNTHGASIDLWGEKDADMLPYFDGHSMSTIKIGKSGVLGTRVRGLPNSWKGLPSLDEGTSYLYGWLAGYIAADGSVNSAGGVNLYSSRKEHLEHAENVATLLGIETMDIRTAHRAGYGSDLTPLYRLPFVAAFIPEDLLLVTEHRRRWQEAAPKKPMIQWKVESVEDFGEVEEVFCAEVPETETFALTSSIWTHNCQNMHKRMTGLYTGDRLHREGINSIRGAGEPTPDFSAGIMVALYVPDNVANKIAIPDGLPPKELHITLAFLGNVDEYDDGTAEVGLVERVTDAVTGIKPLEGAYQGKGIFVNDDEIVTWLSPDLPGINELRQSIIDALAEGEWNVRENHGFTPHTTIAYGDVLDDVVVEKIPVTFDAVSVVWGTNRYDIPLGTNTTSGEESDD